MRIVLFVQGSVLGVRGQVKYRFLLFKQGDNFNCSSYSAMFLSPSVQCSDLQDPVDGNVELTSNGTVTMATYSCDLGASLNGTETRTCSADGSWSGGTPNCGMDDLWTFYISFE